MAHSTSLVDGFTSTGIWAVWHNAAGGVDYRRIDHVQRFEDRGEMIFTGCIVDGVFILAVDVTVNVAGSIITFTPESQHAIDWFAENVEAESWQWLGRALCVDARCADAIAAGLLADGFILS